MVRVAMIGAAAILVASAALAAPGDEASQQTALVDRFMPFDQAAGDDWAATTQTPLYLSAAADKSAGAPLTLQPGAYRVVVLCDCGQMEVTLVGPDGAAVPAERSDERRARPGCTWRAAAAYLAGVDMDECDYAKCAVGVKVYRKKD